MLTSTTTMPLSREASLLFWWAALAIMIPSAVKATPITKANLLIIDPPYLGDACRR
jgi:hypothetical protein